MKQHTESKTTTIKTVYELRDVLQADHHRDVYQGQGGGYYVSYSGGILPENVLAAALRDGLLKPRWPDETRMACWVLR